MGNAQPPAQDPSHPVTAIQPAQYELSVEQLSVQVDKIQKLIKDVMKEGQHYGIIPGTKKKTLYKAGSELLCWMFRFGPQYQFTLEEGPGAHRTYTVTCSLIHIPTGVKVGEGMGICSTREKKYAYRVGQRLCPDCKAPCIRRSKFERDGDKGWYCHAGSGGCNASFFSGDKRITDQEIGMVENPELPDCYNTVLKMGNKRALAAAVLTATAASDIFTQDLDEKHDPAHFDGTDQGGDPGGWGGEPYEDPAPWREKIAAARDMVELGAVGQDLAQASLAPEDHADLRAEYGRRLKVLSPRKQGDALDDVAKRQQQRSGA